MNRTMIASTARPWAVGLFVFAACSKDDEAAPTPTLTETTVAATGSAEDAAPAESPGKGCHSSSHSNLHLPR